MSDQVIVPAGLVPGSDPAPRPRMLTRSLLGRIVAGLLILVLLLLSAPPLIAVLIISFQKGTLLAHPVWTFANYVTVYRQFLTGGPLPSTLIFATGSALLALLLGGILAFIVERTNAPFRGLGYLVAIGVVAIPGPVYAIGWMLLFGRSGLINTSWAWACQLADVSCEPFQITNFAGMIAVEGLGWTPLAFLLLVGPIRSVDRSLEEAAITCRATSFQVFRYITGPLLLPAVVAILLLAFIRALEAFAVPAIIGMPGRIAVITTEIYYTAVQQIPPEFGLAGAYSVVLVAIVTLLLFVYARLTAKAAHFTTITGKGSNVRILKMGRMRYVLAGILLLYAVVLVGIPLLIMVTASLQKYYNGITLTGLTLFQYETMFSYSQIAHSFVNSMVVGLLSATAIMALSFLAAWISVRGAGKTRRAVDMLVSLPLVLPGIVLGLALLQEFANAPFPIYGTIGALVIAGVTRFIPFGFRFTHAGMLQIHPELEEAGWMCGASQFQVLARIVMPLIALPMIAGFLYVFLNSARELEASVLLVTPGTPMVAPVLVGLFEEGTISQVAAFSTVIVFVFGVIAYSFYFIARRLGLIGRTA